ncbi:hypothetical protein L1987_76232 [Smallanthus sonchifolius]|uniref:Uncharacterized protein n=1 Tax=Smallanthus sonchifolius TaxID=185202 RepID=A0ACB9A7L4_9ASTR|nr:hypothetical protein L1987_76232 [Smallanthus sonchifolius]
MELDEEVDRRLVAKRLESRLIREFVAVIIIDEDRDGLGERLLWRLVLFLDTLLFVSMALVARATPILTVDEGKIIVLPTTRSQNELFILFKEKRLGVLAQREQNEGDYAVSELYESKVEKKEDDDAFDVGEETEKEDLLELECYKALTHHRTEEDFGLDTLEEEENFCQKIKINF